MVRDSNQSNFGLSSHVSLRRVVVGLVRKKQGTAGGDKPAHDWCGLSPSLLLRQESRAAGEC